MCAFVIVESKYSVKTKYIVADFSNGKEIYDEIEQQLSGIPVGILGKFSNKKGNYFLIMIKFQTLLICVLPIENDHTKKNSYHHQFVLCH